MPGSTAACAWPVRVAGAPAGRSAYDRGDPISPALLSLVAPRGQPFAIDVDPLKLPRTAARLRGPGFDESTLLIQGMTFAGVCDLLLGVGGGFDFVRADSGVSSMQIDNPARGFDFKLDRPLKLRPDPGQIGHDMTDRPVGVGSVGAGQADRPTACGARPAAIWRGFRA